MKTHKQSKPFFWVEWNWGFMWTELKGKAAISLIRSRRRLTWKLVRSFDFEQTLIWAFEVEARSSQNTNTNREEWILCCCCFKTFKPSTPTESCVHYMDGLDSIPFMANWYIVVLCPFFFFHFQTFFFSFSDIVLLGEKLKLTDGPVKMIRKGKTIAFV